MQKKNNLGDTALGYIQREYWEHDKVLKRRSPDHPVIESFSIPKIQLLLKHINLDGISNRKPPLLELGSGNGYLSFYLKRNFDITCLDFAYTILSNCPIRKRIQATATHLPFNDGIFPVVFCANLLHHVDSPVDVVCEMARVSSRYVVILEPNRSNPLMQLISFISPNDKALRKFSSRYLSDLIKNRLDLISITPTGGILPNVTPLFILPILKKIEWLMFPKLYYLLVAKKKDEIK